MATPPRVIKAGQVLGVKPAAFNAVDTVADLEDRIKAAQAEIERYQAAAAAQVNELKERTRQEAFAAGREEGLAKGREEALASHRAELEAEVARRTEPLHQALAEATRRLLEAREQWTAEWEGLGLELACAIAERVVRDAVAKPNRAAERTLGEILSLVGKCPQVTVTLHPADAETLSLDDAGWSSATQAIGKINVVADPTMTPGGCKVASEFGVIDATVETQLDRIRQELTGVGETSKE